MLFVVKRKLSRILFIFSGFLVSSFSLLAGENARGDAVLIERVQQADPAQGERVAAICRGCHNMERGGGHKMGPNLWGIVNAPRARHQEYSYSDGMKSKPGVWSIESLDAFLTRPSKYIPGTRMGYYGMKNPKRRAAVIAYLRTLSEKPAMAQAEG
jgi:cytochrome c